MSNGPMFHQTRMGQIFFEVTVPKIAEALTSIAKAMNRESTVAKVEDALTMEIVDRNRLQTAIRTLLDVFPDNKVVGRILDRQDEANLAEVLRILRRFA